MNLYEAERLADLLRKSHTLSLHINRMSPSKEMDLFQEARKLLSAEILRLKQTSRDTPPNKLISIGYLGCMRVYLNMPLEEAKRRYQESEGDENPPADNLISEFTFTDEFSAYAVSPN